MDYSGELVDQIGRSGRIDAAAETRSVEHASALRALLGEKPAASPS